MLVAKSCDGFVPIASPFVVKYETEGKIGCEGYRPTTVLVVWIAEENSPPRLITEHSMVVLNDDRSAAALNAGDVGAVVHIYDEGKAYEVEFVDGDGSTIALLNLEPSEVRPIEVGELLHARRRV